MKRGKIKPVEFISKVLYKTDSLKNISIPPIPKKDILSFLGEDCRIIGILNDKMISNLFLNLKTTPNSICKKGYDLIDIYYNFKHEAKTFSKKNGIDFSPSFMKGTKRKFDLEQYQEWLLTINSIILTDVTYVSEGKLSLIGLESQTLYSLPYKMSYKKIQEIISQYKIDEVVIS